MARRRTYDDYDTDGLDRILRRTRQRLQEKKAAEVKVDPRWSPLALRHRALKQREARLKKDKDALQKECNDLVPEGIVFHFTDANEVYAYVDPYRTAQHPEVDKLEDQILVAFAAKDNPAVGELMKQLLELGK